MFLKQADITTEYYVVCCFQRYTLYIMSILLAWFFLTMYTLPVSDLFVLHEIVLVHSFDEFLSVREVHFLHYIIIHRNYMVSDLRLISI